MADGPYLYHKEILPATSLICGTYFQCFNTNAYSYDEYLCSFSPSVMSIFKVDTQLHLEKSERVFGNAKNVKTYHRGSGLNDLLVIAFDESKLVIAEYIPLQNSIVDLFVVNINDMYSIGRTLSSKQHYLGSGTHTIVRTSEPYGSMIAVFYGEEIMFSCLKKANLKESVQFSLDPFIFSPSKQLNLVGPIVDTIFLPGYSKPVIAVLQQESLLPIGHAAKVMHTCVLSVLAIDPISQAVSILWTQKQLPHDSLQLVEMKNDLLCGGVVLVAQNALLVVHPSTIQGLATNGFASVTVSGDIFLRSSFLPSGYELHGSSWIDNSEDSSNVSVLGFLSENVVIIIDMVLNIDNMPTSLSFKVQNIGHVPKPSFACFSSAKSTIFLGRYHGPCCLFKIERSNVLSHYKLYENKNVDKYCLLGLSKKRSRNDLEQSFESEKEFLHHENHTFGICRRIFLVQMDEFSVFGPLVNAFFTKRDESFSATESVGWERISKAKSIQKQYLTAASYIADREAKDSFVVSCGLDSAASLCRFSCGVGLGKIGTRNFPGATRLHTISVGTFCLIVVSYDGKSRIFICKEDKLKLVDKQCPELKFSELSPEDCGFICTSSTLIVNSIVTNNTSQKVICQVVSTGTRLVFVSDDWKFDATTRKDKFLNYNEDEGGMGGSAGEFIVTGDICSSFVVLLTNFGTMVLYEYRDYDLVLVMKKPFYESNCYLYQLLGEEIQLRSFSSTLISVSLFQGDLSMHLDSSNRNIDLENDVRKENSEEVKEFEDLYGDVCMNTKNKHSSSTDGENSYPKKLSFYMVTAEANGCVSFIDILQGVCIFRSYEFLRQHEFIKSQQCMEFVQDSPVKTQYIVEARVLSLDSVTKTAESSVNSQTKLLTLLFHTGEIVVYKIHEYNEKILAFHKVITKTIHNKRYPSGKAGQNSVLHSNDNPNGQSQVAYIDSEDFIHRVPQSIFSMKNLENNCDCILVSANDPFLITIEKGYPVMLSLGFPELPYINYGHHIAVPVEVMGKSLIGTMWIEFDDIESFKNHIHMRNRAQKQSTLGIYYFLPRQSTLLVPNVAGTGLCFQKMTVKRTVHKCLEMLRNTDNKTEQALLEKKTILLLTSFQKRKKFNTAVVDGEDKETEDVLFERYFPILESFQQPDEKLAPLPQQNDREFHISLLQNGNIVDSYPIPLNECALDIAVVYFALDKSPPAASTGGILGPTPAKVLEKRVYVLVSTMEKDKRGEDSQGNGRLLLLTLDYAMFDDALNNEADTNDMDLPKDDTYNIQLSNSETDINEPKGSKIAKPIVTSAQQQFLGAIQPKLKLLWSGPGPASVVKQMPQKDSDGWSNYVVATVGSTLYIYKFNSNTNEMDQVAFYFAQVIIIC